MHLNFSLTYMMICFEEMLYLIGNFQSFLNLCFSNMLKSCDFLIFLGDFLGLKMSSLEPRGNSKVSVNLA